MPPGSTTRTSSGGDIVWSAASGAQIVLNGPIRDRWLALKASSGALGVPVGSDTVVGEGGHVVDFRGGSIYWSAGTGAHDVRGAILAAYVASGGPTGPLGYPTTDDAPAPGGRGYVVDFQGGSIYWSPATGAHIVVGAVNDAYRAAGGTTSSFGYPVSDTYVVYDGRRVDFQHGSITR
jgi:uncharacterized protein with LGFP repeats